jgi:hypothetical protein
MFWHMHTSMNVCICIISVDAGIRKFKANHVQGMYVCMYVCMYLCMYVDFSRLRIHDEIQNDRSCFGRYVYVCVCMYVDAGIKNQIFGRNFKMHVCNTILCMYVRIWIFAGYAYKNDENQNVLSWRSKLRHKWSNSKIDVETVKFKMTCHGFGRARDDISRLLASCQRGHHDMYGLIKSGSATRVWIWPQETRSSYESVERANHVIIVSCKRCDYYVMQMMIIMSWLWCNDYYDYYVMQMMIIMSWLWCNDYYDYYVMQMRRRKPLQPS